jgi:hypothetical protein
MRLKTKRLIRRVCKIAVFLAAVAISFWIGFSAVWSDECTGILKWSGENLILIPINGSKFICAFPVQHNVLLLEHCLLGDTCRVVGGRTRLCAHDPECIVMLDVDRAGLIK